MKKSYAKMDRHFQKHGQLKNIQELLIQVKHQCHSKGKRSGGIWIWLGTPIVKNCFFIQLSHQKGDHLHHLLGAFRCYLNEHSAVSQWHLFHFTKLKNNFKHIIFVFTLKICHWKH